MLLFGACVSLLGQRTLIMKTILGSDLPLLFRQVLFVLIIVIY